MNINNKKELLQSLASKELFIFDMDGTIYLEYTPFPDAVRLINVLSAAKRKYLFFTNNSSKSKSYYVDKLNRLGFTASESNMLTSANVLISYLSAFEPRPSVFLVGTPLLEAEFTEAGISLESGNPDFVVTSFDTTLTYKKVERACTLIRNGVKWLSTHPDVNCPVEGGYIPDCGAINAMISASTGKSPRIFGKPHSDVVNIIERIYNVARDKMVIFGDRLYTDIALGKENGVLTALVLTGEATLEEALSLPEEKRPDLIFNTIGESEKFL